MIEFGRHAERDRRDRGDGPPESCTFLGMRHICGRTRNGAFQVVRRTDTDRLRAKLIQLKQDLRSRMHLPVPDLFIALPADPLQLIFWQTLFMILTVYIISRGVISGLETAVRWFMPMLFILMVVLLGYAVTSDGWSQGVEFMFRMDFASLTPDAVLAAMGQAFFTLSLGMGAIMAYGAYVPSSASIFSSVSAAAMCCSTCRR